MPASTLTCDAKPFRWCKIKRVPDAPTSGRMTLCGSRACLRQFASPRSLHKRAACRQGRGT
eukprot:1159681-Pelagomonas_calceolata.AAC.4